MSPSPDTRKQSKKIVYNVYNYLKYLVTFSPEVPVKEFLTQTQKATAEACGVSVRTVQRICSEAEKSVAACSDDAEPTFESPKKKAPRTKRVTELDDFKKEIVRRTVQEFYDRGEYPTCRKLKEVLGKRINFSGSIKSLWIILKKNGFKYKKCHDGRRLLMERTEIVASRVAFLRRMYNIRKETQSRPIIYLDETWINQYHSDHYGSNGSASQACAEPSPLKGTCLIVCHAGSAQHGFVNGAKLILQSKGTSDNHQEVIGQVFNAWFVDLLRKLEEPSVIVMDSAWYHCTPLVKIPSTNTPKSNIVAWLKDKVIPHDPSSTVPELLSVVRQHKRKYEGYELDVIANQMGHEVVRLPLYHCQYNPMELIWAEVKTEIAKQNTTFKVNDVKVLLEEALSRVSVHDWRACVNHSEKLQEDDFVQEGVRDEIIQPFMINLRDDSDSSFTESESEDEF